ncbi:MAG: hypothetical protein K2K75_03110 [Muribaculaceae bacterium]|nr:hypothetical protein [Muribaculaceae bacterium]
MRTILKQVAVVATTMCLCLLANGQGKSNLQKNTKLDSSTPTLLTNNGHLLSKKGIESIQVSELTFRNVWKDTVYITVKDDVLMRLDKDSSNYSKQSKGTRRFYRGKKVVY